MADAKNDARLNPFLAGEVNKTIEDGQLVTRLSERDGQFLQKMLDDQLTKPNNALVNAVKRFNKQVV